MSISKFSFPKWTKLFKEASRYKVIYGGRASSLNRKRIKIHKSTTRARGRSK